MPMPPPPPLDIALFFYSDHRAQVSTHYQYILHIDMIEVISSTYSIWYVYLKKEWGEIYRFSCMVLADIFKHKFRL
jgi:hypothetical protein